MISSSSLWDSQVTTCIQKYLQVYNFSTYLKPSTNLFLLLLILYIALSSLCLSNMHYVPFSSCAVTLAPLLINICTTDTKPCFAAIWSGVFCSQLEMLVFSFSTILSSKIRAALSCCWNAMQQTVIPSIHSGCLAKGSVNWPNNEFLIIDPSLHVLSDTLKLAILLKIKLG